MLKNHTLLDWLCPRHATRFSGWFLTNYSSDTCSEEHKAETAVQDTAKGLHVARACYLNNNHNFNANDRNINNYNNAVRGIVQQLRLYLISNMDNIRDLWQELCNYDNLFLAYKKARKHKTTLDYVIDFEKNLEHNLLLLRSELLLHSYQPKPLISFIIRDPKTRKISKSDFRDRIVHHALCNIIEPIFDKSFIYDSYANRIGKGTLKAIQRFDVFKRAVSKNNTVRCYILKADIRKYFENVDHEILIGIIKKKVADKRVLWLIRKIFANYSFIIAGRGMPLGNLTSQFFANVYLNELDWFVKHILKAKYYIRYVDDFVILESNKKKLELYKKQIDEFLKSKLNLQLHKDKSKLLKLSDSITFLGFRVFYYYKLLKKSNIRKMKQKFKVFLKIYKLHEVDYDSVYDFLEGWIVYVKNVNTYKLKKNVITEFEHEFPNEISTKEINRWNSYLHQSITIE